MVLSCLFVSCQSVAILGILCAWTTMHMPRGSCWPPSGRLEKTTGSSTHHMAQHHPTGSETSPSYAPQSSRFCSEPPSVEDDVDVWRYAIVSCMPETTTSLSPAMRTAAGGGSLLRRPFGLQCTDLLVHGTHYLRHCADGCETCLY